MKRTLILLWALVFLYSCGKNEDLTDYLDNKLIEGTWYTTIDGRDSALYIFKNNKATQDFYAHINGLEELKPQGKIEMGNYLLTDSFIILPQRHNRQYKLNGNNLSIKDPTDWITYRKIKN